MTRLRVYTLAPKRISATCALWALLSTSPTFLSLDSGLAQAAQPTQKSLRAFASEEELNAWLQTKKSLFEKNRADVEAHSAKNMALPSVVYAPAPVQDSLPQNESVTNNQTAGVDEGGIVKVHKNHLVILRRGRLFTVRITNNTLQPVDMQDAFAPGSSGHAWYDEMLVSDNTVVVIGYSYDKGGTEVILFGIDDGGHLSYYDTYVLRSNDYYSSRNYASRLIGNTLVFYAPLHLHFYRNPLDCFPATLLWQKNEKASFKPIAPATRIYRTTDDLDPTQDNITLHTVMACEISKNKLDCSASAVLGPSGREFYVAKDAVYVWSAPSQHYYGKPAEQMPVAASVFRLPLNTQEAPTALKTYGSPIDQFSFLESTDGYLHVLLRAEGPAPSMWASEQGSHELALLRIPLRDFGDGSTSAPPEHYFPLPSPKGGSSLQNRYIGDYLVYGAGQTWLQTQEKVSGLAYLLKWDNPGQVESITPPHRVDRIEALGKAPLLVGGNEGHLYFSVLDFRTTTPPPPQKNKIPPPAETKQTLKQLARIADTFKLKNAAQGETRSHGFFYKPDTGNNESGLMGLPYARSGRPGWKQLKEAPSGILFLRNHHLRFSEAGALLASLATQKNDDQCKASCTDWYGNSRPLFVANRIFALMGYELVEGKMVDNRLKETRRINFFQKNKRNYRNP